MITFPNKIHFLSDNSECEFVNEIVDKNLKERTANFEYTKGYYFLNSKVSLGLIQIEKLIKNNLIEVR